ncbi:MAG: carbohydrate ABC transporter substrate-binding protein [Clostridia bacterium]|nr:carbohydrate ABC transporter substrate-binding protein [Clostridia bacterium]
MKKTICMLLAMLLALLTPIGALGESGNVILLQQESNPTITVSSAAAVGDTAYMILRDQDGSAVWSIQAGETERQRFALQEDGEQKISPSSMKLFALGGELMALNINTGKVCSIELADGKAIATEKITLDWKLYGQVIGKCVASDDALYLLASDWSGDSVELIAFNLTDGSSRVLESRRSWGDIAVCEDGRLVAALRDDKDKYAPYILYEISTETGEMTKLLTLADHTARGVSYDEEGERFVYLCSNTIWATDLKGRHAELGSSLVKAPSVIEWDGGAGLMDGGYYFVSGREGALVTNINPSEQPPRTLTITSVRITEMDGAYIAFTEEHPEADLKWLTLDDELSTSEVTQAMMFGSSEIDIYYLRVSSEAYRALAERGYAADLSGSEVLSAMTERMFPAFRDALTENGKLIALPGDVWARGYQINRKLAEEIGIHEGIYPDTWDKLLDLIERWDESYSKEFPEKMPFDPRETANMKETLIYMLLNAQVTAMNKPGAEVSVDTPFMRETLNRLDGMDFAAFASEKDFSDGYSYSFSDVLLQGAGGINLPISLSRGEEGMEPLLLAFSEEEEALIGLEMYAYVVNPYSKNIDLAIDYLEARAQTMDKGMQATLFADWREPLRDPFNDQRIAVYDQFISEQQTALTKAADDEKQAIEADIKSAEAARQMFLRMEYVWTEEMLAEYRRMAENFVVIQNEYLMAYHYGTEEGREIKRLVSRYVDGQMSADQMLTTFDQKLRMMQMEEGD